jgi:hypothetical protein
MKIFFRKWGLDFAIQTELELPLQHHQEPVLLVPTEFNATVVKR